MQEMAVVERECGATALISGNCAAKDVRISSNMTSISITGLNSRRCWMTFADDDDGDFDMEGDVEKDKLDESSSGEEDNFTRLGCTRCSKHSAATRLPRAPAALLLCKYCTLTHPSGYTRATPAWRHSTA